ncbi:11993_t:CDS:1, partial [Gigaspora rosea]
AKLWFKKDEFLDNFRYVDNDDDEFFQYYVNKYFLQDFSDSFHLLRENRLYFSDHTRY